MTTTADHRFPGTDIPQPVPLVSAMLCAAHTVFAGQQALHTDSIRPLDLTEHTDRGRAPAPLLVGDQAEAILAELEGF
ncbi:hypothetical protein [Pseudactinotalea terrae]|uniref:hypothetical protein n=1 Tax=Pseudactinotalea terrae TaxID=1743262 RepID=UPI0012E26E31|nr:hypothetical protein [Pseudactinotalea terrae]